MTDRVLEFGTAKAGPGERGTGYIKVGELCDGSPVNMPVIILGMLDEMNGSVVALPATNISAFRGNPFGGGQRNSPLDIDQGARLPSMYAQANPYGKHTNQLAYQIVKTREKYDPDVLIRMHGCKQMYGWDRVLFQKSPPGSKLDNLARAAVTKPGTMVMLTFDRETGERPLTISMESNGGDDGVGNGFNGDNMRDGVLNVMRHLKMIPGEEIKVDKIQYVSYRRVKMPDGNVMSSGGITTTRGGFFKSLVEVKDEVREGQLIGEIRNFFGEVVEEIRSGLPSTAWC